jgi:hypothetical protein
MLVAYELPGGALDIESMGSGIMSQSGLSPPTAPAVTGQLADDGLIQQMLDQAKARAEADSFKKKVVVAGVALTVGVVLGLVLARVWGD